MSTIQNARTANSAGTDDIYTSLSYISNPFPQSAPDRLFGLAHLFGLEAPRIETANILELGCSQGGNIIPLAARFPGARFLGIDLAPRHVAEANERVAALGLSNIEIREGDVAAVDLGTERFDAIICHGVYSWVPERAREAILGIVGRHLAPDGVAFVSYNVFPGWHLRGIIRDLMLFHAGDESHAPPAQRIAKARWVIDNLSKITNAGSPYGAKLREEAAGLATLGDHYILGEFLAPNNAPCYFRDFNAAAERHGLLFLCETEIEACLPETHGSDVASLIRTMSGNQLLPMEQYIDFLMGRTFRQSLLVHAGQSARIRRQLEPERARMLHVSGKLELVSPAVGQGEQNVYTAINGRKVTAGTPATLGLMRRLADAYPETRCHAELVEQARRAGEHIGAVEEAQMLDLIFQMIVSGILKVSSIGVKSGKAEESSPRALQIARLDARAGRTSTTNLKHETAPIDVVCAAILPVLDGSSQRPMMRDALMVAVKAGRASITDSASGRPLEGERLKQAVADHVELALKRLADAALLEPQVP